jgi:hypothetical protein
MLGLGNAMSGVWQKPQSLARPLFMHAERIMSRLSLAFDAVWVAFGAASF